MAEMNKVDLALKVALSLIIILHCCEGELIINGNLHVFAITIIKGLSTWGLLVSPCYS